MKDRMVIEHSGMLEVVDCADIRRVMHYGTRGGTYCLELKLVGDKYNKLYFTGKAEMLDCFNDIRERLQS